MLRAGMRGALQVANGARPLHVQLFGSFAIIGPAGPLPLPRSRKTRALFVYLLLCGKPVRRERLCELFFERPDDPRAALRWSLTKLREMLGAAANALRGDADRISLDPDRFTTDADRLLAALDSDLIGAEAIDLALEDPLPGLDGAGSETFELWLAAERAQLDGLRARILLRAAADPDMPAPRRALLRSAAADLGCADAPPAARPTDQVIRYCTAPDGVRIAYACTGRGAPLVKAANWLNHLELDWEGPIWNYLFGGLSEDRQLIRYDERGNGLSDWAADDLSFAAFVSDLETVVESLHLDRFPLLGISQGCAVSIAYAAAHPERVSRLILVGGYAVGWRPIASPEEAEQREAMITLVRHGWGRDNPAYRQLFSQTFMPSARPEELSWFNDMQRRSASAENAVRFLETFSRIDVRDLLRAVTCPTLVIHARGDQRVPIVRGMEIAAAIPNAAFVTLDTDSHLPTAREPAAAELLRCIRAFLNEGG